MKILLVVPAEPVEGLGKETSYGSFAQLAMPSVAAATPPGHEIRIIDEKIEQIEEVPRADIVGITLHTAVANRAYSLARRFRESGAFVVLGGPHVTALPEEAGLHGDAVVVGDAEDTWPELLEDFTKRRNRRIYRSAYPPLDSLNSPRLDLLNPGAYPTIAITHATRGCPFKCEFCSVPGVSGRQYRHRPIRKVIEEVERLDGPMVAFWDDNLTADKRYAGELFRELKPLRKRWGAQATVAFATDRQLVRAAGDAGCIGLFLGIESFSKGSLAEVRKNFNKVSAYGEAIRNLHDHGIGVDAGIIFGFDHDDASVFQETLEAAEKIRLDVVNFNILTPFPGTPLYDRMLREGRLTTSDWSRFDPSRHVVFRPEKMSPVELLAGHRWVTESFYQTWPLLKRVYHSPWRNKGLSWFLNRHFQKVMRSFPWDPGLDGIDVPAKSSPSLPDSVSSAPFLPDPPDPAGEA